MGIEFGKLLEKRPVHALGQVLKMNRVGLPTEVNRESLTIQLFWISQLHHLGLISAKKMESHWPSTLTKFLRWWPAKAFLSVGEDLTRPDSDCSKRLVGKKHCIYSLQRLPGHP